MKIITHQQINQELEIIRVSYELKARGALRLADFLYTSLDNGERYKIIDLTDVTEADGLWIKQMEYFVNRGLRIRLFNVGMDIQNLLMLSGKDEVIKTLNCQDIDEAVYLFEKEIIEEEYIATDGVRGRHFPRITTLFQAEFKCSGYPDGEIWCRADVLNLGEGGIQAVLIASFNTKTGQRVNKLQIAERELYDMRFVLNGITGQITTGGKCVWESVNGGEDEEIYMGIRFEDMKHEYTDVIMDYVLAELTKEDIRRGYHVRKKNMMCLS